MLISLGDQVVSSSILESRRQRCWRHSLRRKQLKRILRPADTHTRDCCHIHPSAAMLLYLCSWRNPGAERQDAAENRTQKFFWISLFIRFSLFLLLRP